jgi:nicotinate-nucleotide pyrophosphorylase (carboxylating)
MENIFFYDDIKKFLMEDGFDSHSQYFLNLPRKLVTCHLNIKSTPTVIAGMPYFIGVFRYLMEDRPLPQPLIDLIKFDGEIILDKCALPAFEIPFNVALTGERLALNLLQRASAVATHTWRFSHKIPQALKNKISILDTRKTTPGLKSLEKYAVTLGGGKNHRFTQTDCWMIKDNHKKFFGSIKKSIEFFKAQNSFYNPIILEIHSLDELKEAIELNHEGLIHHVMLDNFSIEMIKSAIALKPKGMTFEISGGLTIETIDQYFLEGVDALSIGELTHNPPRVDISLKIK